MSIEWTNEELALLHAKYSTHGSDIPELLQTRTAIAIGRQAIAYGLQYLPHWSDAEVQILQDKYPTQGSNIPELSHRTRPSIHGKASKLNIKAMFNEPPHIQLTERQWAYIAGFWDGEGTISAHISHSTGGQPQPHLSVCNSNVAVIDQLRRWLGGSMTVRKHSGRDRPMASLMITALPRMIAVLRGMLPHLLVKKQQAELLLCMVESRCQRHTQDSWTEEEREFVGLLHALNN